MKHVKDVLRYFGISTIFLFGAIFLIKYIKEDEIYLNVIIGFAAGLALLIGSFFTKKDEEKKAHST